MAPRASAPSRALGGLLVVGAGQAGFEPRWFKDPAEVARIMAPVSRMVCWFAAAVASATRSAALPGACVAGRLVPLTQAAPP